MFYISGMGFNGSSLTWGEFERALSDRSTHSSSAPDPSSTVPLGDGSDAPAWSRSRKAFSTSIRRRRSEVAYAELHVHSNFSFLDGASHPESLVERAAELGLDAIALTDHNGLYGVVRFAEAARAVGIPTIFGAELTIDSPARRRSSRTGFADPQGGHLVVLAKSPVGYSRLARAITTAQMNGKKTAPLLSIDDLATSLCGYGSGSSDFEDELMILTGCRKGLVTQALEQEGPRAAQDTLYGLVERFGKSNVAVEIWDHGNPIDSARNDALVRIAAQADVLAVATNNVHYATPQDFPRATAISAIRARRCLDDMNAWLPSASMAHIRSGAEQTKRLARYPGVVHNAAQIGLRCAFDLRLIAPNLPPYPCPEDANGQQMSEMQFLRKLVEEGACHRYGTQHDGRHVAFVSRHGVDPYGQLEHELQLIETLGFAGYFLIVWDIVEFCRTSNILCQGRGSAANSAVCFALGVTNADAVALGLLFERFLSPERDGPPDIDIDIESGRREEVIQYVYHRYGRQHAAQVANVITYRSRSAVRDAARALGFTQGQQDAWVKGVDRYNGLAAGSDPLDNSGTSDGHGKDSPQEVLVPLAVASLARSLEHFPRHLGIHSGGMVICDRPVIEVCPTEWARMENRSVLQWDKEDCASAGLVKFDLLGLGMLSALHQTIDVVEEHYGDKIDLALLPQDDDVYDMICRADTIGVFQIESRAQMATLPRLKPRTFYDLVVEIALIRPGPSQGGSVHPYIRRRNGQEPVTYLHPLLEKSLAKTLGVPLFQEQLMQMAIDVAGFSAAEADQLRQAMGSKRSLERMERLKHRLFDGMAEREITGDVAEQIYAKLVAFANYGFPESHSVSFAYLVYASCWLKFHYPAAFCVGLLRSQPMGFYSPHTLIQDARRHGVTTLSPDLNRSKRWADLEQNDSSASGFAIRLGFDSVRHVGSELARRIHEGQPYGSIEEFARTTGARRNVLEALATAGAFVSLGVETPGALHQSSRRKDMWTAGVVGLADQARLPGIVTGIEAPDLPVMTEPELAIADLWSTGVAPDGHPTKFLREELRRHGVVAAEQLHGFSPNATVVVGGLVTHRQRPATAGGTMFVNLEDETGLINVVCSLGCWKRYRQVIISSPALLVRGRLERSEGVVNIIAYSMIQLGVPAAARSRDFR